MAWKRFPIRAGTKQPALEGDWRSHATDDEVTIQGWLDAGLDLGVDCGASGLFVIDVDGVQGEETLRSLPTLPETYTVRTRSGGRHLYFVGVGPSSVQRLGAKLDTRGQGGYVVWDAADYEIIDGRQPAPLPGWVNERLNVSVDRKTSAVAELDLPANVSRARIYLASRAPAIEGEGGNDHTFKTLTALRDLGVSRDVAVDLLLEGWNERCLPPWDAEDLLTVAENAWRYAQNEEGAWGLAGDPRLRFSAIGSAADGDPVADKPDRYRLWDVPEALTRPPPEWLFPGILPAKAVTLLYGEQEVGKTWLALDQALYLASGLNGYRREPGLAVDVVYFAGEGFEDLAHNRVTAWCEAHELDPADVKLHLLENFPSVADDSDVDLLVQAVIKKGIAPRLIVLDTYARVLAEAGLSENDPADIMKFIRQAEILKRGFGCTVMAIHHRGKDAERGARGHNALIAAVDAAYEIEADWKARAFSLTCRKLKGAVHPPAMFFRARSVAKGLVFDGVTEQEYRDLTHARDALSNAKIGAALVKIHATGGERITSYTLATALHGQPLHETQEETDSAIARIERQLVKAAHGRLAAYVAMEGRIPMWGIPETGEAPAGG